MGKSIHRHGTVLEGNYAGKNVYWFSDTGISILSNDENGKIIVQSFFSTRFTVLCTISKATVETYTTISESPSYTDVALYFKDGNKCLVRFFSELAYQELKRIMFKL